MYLCKYAKYACSNINIYIYILCIKNAVVIRTQTVYSIHVQLTVYYEILIDVH